MILSQPVSVYYRENRWVKDLLLILGASFILSLLVYVSIPLPFTPVPLVLQNTFAVLLGIFLGPKKGALAVVAFLTQGLLGLPVFALGKVGLACFLGPTGGYLIGYVAAAFVSGFLFIKLKSKHRILISMLFGTLTVYLFGLPWLANFVGIKSVLALGFLPFTVGDLLKIFLVTAFLKKIKER